MSEITVWTKQHDSIISALDTQGRYVAKKDFILKDLDLHAHLVLEAYDWLVKNTPNASWKPKDADYPIWLSFSHDAAMMASPGSVILELSISSHLVTNVNINKWGAILNYSYISANQEDEKRHKDLLAQYGISDAKAFMTQFYPQIRKEILQSWNRLFDDNISLGNSNCYGNIWEIRREWVTQIIK